MLSSLTLISKSGQGEGGRAGGHGDAPRPPSPVPRLYRACPTSAKETMQDACDAPQNDTRYVALPPSAAVLWPVPAQTPIPLWDIYHIERNCGYVRSRAFGERHGATGSRVTWSDYVTDAEGRERGGERGWADRGGWHRSHPRTLARTRTRYVGAWCLVPGPWCLVRGAWRGVARGAASRAV